MVDATPLLQPGNMVAGRYRLERLLGRGGMGVVWAATHSVTRREVALKLLTADVTATARRRFLREARAASAVRHPNIIDIYDFLELDDGSPVMVMELLSGEALAARLQREQRIPLEETASILLPVLAAVGAAHEAGIVHRDLKPENIFLASERVKVLDFGIAKLTAVEGNAARSTDLTESGTVLGTPFYMAPEQVFGERDIDYRSDIWALGLILYECLSGVLPTRAENVGQVLRRITWEDITPIADVAVDIPSDVAEVVGRMLSRDRDARPMDLRQVADVLARHTTASAPSFAPPGRLVIVNRDDAEPLAATRDARQGSTRIMKWWSRLLGSSLGTKGSGSQMRPPPIVDHGRGASTSDAALRHPVPNNLPLRRLFMGRERELSNLDEAIESNQRASLFALAGMGKTALALEYAHRAAERRAYPGGIWWILAEGQPHEAMIKLAAALRAGAPALLAHVRPEAAAEEQAEAARIALQNHPSPSLLVFDNVSEPGLLERLPGGEVRVLLTLRDRRLSVGEIVQVGPLVPDDARALVDALAGVPQGKAEAKARDQVIHQDLGGLAVAVEVAANAVREWAGGWSAYRGHLAEQMTEALDAACDRSEHYPRGVLAALDLSIHQYRDDSPEQRLLGAAAVFAPDGVPLSWAYRAAELPAASIEGKRARANLERVGLIKVDRAAETLSIHRLIHRRVNLLRGLAQQGLLGRTCVAEWITSAVGRTRTQMEEIDLRRAHVESALGAEQDAILSFGIATEFARHLRYRARYGESRALCERVLLHTFRLIRSPPL